MLARRAARIPALLIAAVVLVVVVAVGCTAKGDVTPGAPVGTGDGGAELLVLGAASLSDVLDDLARAFGDAYPGLQVVVSTDGSDALRARIEEGVTADVFVSADTANPDRVARAGLSLGAPVVVATSSIVVAVAPQRRDDIRSPAHLADPGVRIVAAGRGVPISAYAQEAVERLAALDGYPADFADRVAANIVSREDNVRAALAKVMLGEGDAAFVYATDVIGLDDLGVLELPPEAAVEAEYAAVALSAAREPGLARDFVAWLGTPPARAILAAAGFGPVLP